MPEQQWSEMTPQEKREQRFKWWLEPEGVTFDSTAAEKAYKERVQRMIDAYNVEEPDRVPVSLPVAGMPADLYGDDYFTCSHDYEKAVAAWDKFNEHFPDADTLPSPGSVIPARAYELLDFKLYSWPGHGLSQSAEGIQFNEGEYMKAGEYDQLVRDPSDFWLRTFIPRIVGVMEPWGDLSALTTLFESPIGFFAPFATPDMQQSLATLQEMGGELGKYLGVLGEWGRKTMAAGYPSLRSAMAKAPFDTIGDTLRGTKGIIIDMRRCPDKLHAALDVVTRLTISQTIEQLNRSKGFVAMFPLHKGADGWMSDKQFQEFYWPYLKRVINAFIDEGILVHLFAEGAFETRLDSVNEFPKGAVSWLFDRTDMGKAKKALGDKCCIAGNVPTSLLITGTPDGVKDYCRELIETCAPGGGYMLAGGAMADKGNIPNLRAMMDAAIEYGTYKK